MKRVLAAVPFLLAAASAEAEARKPYTRNVAIVIYENVQPLDWTGPYEVYNDAGRFGAAGGENAFNVYTVSKTTEPLDGQGLRLIPHYSIENAPKPDIVVFPGGPSSKVHGDPVFFAWAEKVAKEAEIAQSVCTGAFVLAKAGLLDGLEVTTFHGAIDSLQREYPKTAVKRGRRFVDNGRIVTTAGISAGIDGSLHVVARLLGRRVADEVARYMEYAWSPEASLAGEYSYFNPSTDERGRRNQAAALQYEEKRYAEAEQSFRAILAEDPASTDGWSGLGYTLRALKQHAGAADALVRSVGSASDGHAAWVMYQAAVQYALAGRKDDAFATLGKAYAMGYPDRNAIEKDADLASLRADPRAKQLAAAR
jgi:putative intracellular protease/amidase